MMALLISLVTVITQMGYWLFFTTTVEVYGPYSYGMPLMVISSHICYFDFQITELRKAI